MFNSKDTKSSSLGNYDYSDLSKDYIQKWASFKEETEKRKSFYKDFLNIKKDKDTTLCLTLEEINSKIKLLTGVLVDDDWTLKNFKESLVEFQIDYKIMDFKSTISSSPLLIDWFYHHSPSILDDKIDAISYVYAKFDPLKTIQIMDNLLADRIIWNEYNGRYTLND